MPNPSTFPFKAIKVELWDSDDDAKGDDANNSGPVSSEEGSPPSVDYVIEGQALSEALQYSATSGLPALLGHLETLRQHYHEPTDRLSLDMASLEVPRAAVVTTGSQDALTKVRNQKTSFFKTDSND